jgi:hypothetical protein
MTAPSAPSKSARMALPNAGESRKPIGNTGSEAERSEAPHDGLQDSERGIGHRADPPEARCARSHFLKTWPVYFQGLVDGTKTAEVRINDRDFRVGDELVLYEFDPNAGGPFSGREEFRTISRVDDLSNLTAVSKLVLLSFVPTPKSERSHD